MCVKAGTVPVPTLPSQCLAQRIKGHTLITDRQISFYLV